MEQIVLRNVTKRFTTKTLGDIVAVDNFNLAVNEGECFSFLGPSGCGKSTTLRMIAGFEDLSDGEIELCGRPVSIKSKNLYVPPEERGLGMVFQAFAVWPHMTVFENVAFPLRIQKMNRADIERKAQAVACARRGGVDDVGRGFLDVEFDGAARERLFGFRKPDGHSGFGPHQCGRAGRRGGARRAFRQHSAAGGF